MSIYSSVIAFFLFLCSAMSDIFTEYKCANDFQQADNQANKYPEPTSSATGEKLLPVYHLDDGIDRKSISVKIDLNKLSVGLPFKSLLKTPDAHITGTSQSKLTQLYLHCQK